MQPIIGITMYTEQARWGVWDRPATLLPRSYVDSVASAGGVPMLLPAVPDGATEVAGTLDGLLLAGGADVDPVHYGQSPHPSTDFRPDRDAWELALLRAALDRGLPVFGVCRGLQLLNVACDGTLRQHLPEATGHPGHQPRAGVFGSTRITLRPDSRLGALLGAQARGPCYHHQAIHELGTGLAAVGWADDGTTEAVESTEHDFVVAVQWHPEEDPGDDRLFKAFVAECLARKDTR